MRKKEYIEKAKQSIVNKVKFHAPILYDGNVDKEVLKSRGVDVNLPIFKFDKLLTKSLFEAFVLAEQEIPFNLLVQNQNLAVFSQRTLKKFKNLVVYSAQNVSSRFLEMINKLNINYSSASNYNVEYKDKFFKVNGEILNPKYTEFSLEQKFATDNVDVTYREFVLNGTNAICTFENGSQERKTVDVEFNLPLKQGYYYFKRKGNSVCVENLTSKEKFFLNFCGRGLEFCFSNVDGLENSVFSCVNFKAKINLEPNQSKVLFFNLGFTQFCLKNYGEIKRYESVAFEKTSQIFDIRVKTKNPRFDNFFNHELPKKIWVGWLNGAHNELLEQKYITLRRLFVVGKNAISFVPFRKIGIKEIGVFNGEYYKKIYVVSGEEKFLKVGQSMFYNINGITDASLKSKEPICLCFGK